MTDEALGGLFAEVRPGQACALFEPYAVGGWSGAGLAAALSEEAKRMGINTKVTARSAFGLLKVLLRPYEPDAKLFYTLGVDRSTGELTTDNSRSAAALGERSDCADCDGYGRRYVTIEGVEHDAGDCVTCAA